MLAAALLFTLIDADGTALAPREAEFPFQDQERLAFGETHGGKLFRSHGLPEDGRAVPLMIFVHGILSDHRKHHWLIDDAGGSYDARPFIDALVDSGQVEPLVVAVPSQNNADGYDPSKIFAQLDFDAFVDAVDETLAPLQHIDREKIVVLGHSASACYRGNGSFAVVNAKTFVARALIAVDGCLSPESATLLATTTRVRDVIVAYQDQVWTERPFDDFVETWAHDNTENWAQGLRVLYHPHFDNALNAHMDLVKVAVQQWLPVLLPPIDHVSLLALLSSPPVAGPVLAMPILF
ncbi:MAG: hypothetical protein NVSMB1_19630 [Polyangiales bacterium]